MSIAKSVQTTQIQKKFLKTTGRIALTDPATGIERRLAVIGRLDAVGLRVFGISGIWFTTEDLPFASGKFDIAIRRR